MSVQTDTFMLGGGLNLVAPYLALKSGSTIDAINFEPGMNGGYRRIDGYERFDGRPSPSAQNYRAFELSSVTGIVVGQVLTGVVSGATAKVVGIDVASMVVGVSKLTGTFQTDESLGGSITLVEDDGLGHGPDALDAAWRLAAQNLYRADIGMVPGSGRILGVIQFGAYAVAFRNNVGGTAAVPYKSGSGGWVALTLGHTVRFKAGSGVFVVGNVITTATGSATVRKAVTYNGATATNDASGFLVLSGATGAVTDGQAILVGGVQKALADGAMAAVSFQPGGSFRFAQHNFYGGTGTYSLYGCDGKNPAFEWDGTTLAPILMPSLAGTPSVNKPVRVLTHAGHLFLAFAGGSLQHSVVGEPLTFSGFMGAAEFGLGDEITDLQSQAGDALLVFTRKSTQGLYGNGIDNWQLKPVAPECGAIGGTVQTVGASVALDDRGLTLLQRVQAYGNFASGTISSSIKPLIDRQRKNVTVSAIVRESNQYRLYFSNSQFLIAYFPGGDRAPEYMLGEYPLAVRCISNAESSTGDEMRLFGSDNGYVYQDGVGINFDGEIVHCHVRLPFNHAKTARIRKRYRRGQMDLDSASALSLSFSAEIDYGNPNSLQPDAFTNTSVTGGGGYYDASSWDEVYWDGQSISNANFDLDGTGVNLSMAFMNESATTPPFTLHSLQIDFEQRRRER